MMRENTLRRLAARTLSREMRGSAGEHHGPLQRVAFGL